MAGQNTVAELPIDRVRAPDDYETECAGEPLPGPVGP